MTLQISNEGLRSWKNTLDDSYDISDLTDLHKRTTPTEGRTIHVYPEALKEFFDKCEAEGDERLALQLPLSLSPACYFRRPEPCAVFLAMVHVFRKEGVAVVRRGILRQDLRVSLA